MASPNEHVVDFENPPVAEVSLAVQLQGPTLDTSATLSKFWPTIADRYPRVVPQPALPPMDESFEIPSQQIIRFQFLGGPGSERWHMETEDECEFVNVQGDRFGYTWRRRDADAEYPRYGQVRKGFEDSYSGYLDLAAETVGASWCEITYVNPIAMETNKTRADLSELLTRVVPWQLSVLPRPFNTGLSERFQLERDGEPYARFYVDVESTVERPERRLGYTVSLTMRGRPADAGIKGVLDFFDDGREKIVTTFRDITTDEWHGRWGLRR